MGSWGIVRRLRRLLLLSDQDGASLASHLQLGSPQAGSSVSQGDEVDVQQDSWALAPAAEERGAKPTRVQGTLQAPLVALQATSFLDMGAPTEAVLPGAAPSQGTLFPRRFYIHLLPSKPVATRTVSEAAILCIML